MIVNLEILEDYVTKNLLRRREDENLVQYNYTEYCNNEGLWDNITMENRGNIYEKCSGKLVAKSMPKFMNLCQLSEEKQKQLLQETEINVTEKMDGCLGILYTYKGEVRYNSRGAFDNYVTDKIKELLPKYLNIETILEDLILIVEVISKETRIICNYDFEDLYLITAYRKQDMKECDYNEICSIASKLNMPVVKQYNMSWQDLLKFQKQADWQQEGFVVRIGTDRVKIKSEDYLRIAKLRANLCKHTIWKLMKNDSEQKTNVLKTYLDNVPDELVTTAKRYCDELYEDMSKHRSNAERLLETLSDIPTRELQNYFRENPSIYQPCIYCLRSGTSMDKILIRLSEPEKGFEDVSDMIS